jgi:hypothetical protein
MRLAWSGGLLWCALAACTTGSTPRADSGTRADTGTDAARRDAGAMRCTADTDCDDGFECTIDSCIVGNVCDHMALDALCEDGQRCSLTLGCTTGCTNDADCNDGVFCNGTETCLREECYAGMPANCDDGNACTIDTCDMDADGCSYEVAMGCDAGVPGATDAGPPPAFDPATDYTGDFVIAPTQSLGCPPASYAVGAFSLSRSGDTLQVAADWMTMTQTPFPTGASFDVSYENTGCATYRMQGTFSDRDNLTGTWHFSSTGSCGHCGASPPGSFVGVRR